MSGLGARGGSVGGDTRVVATAGRHWGGAARESLPAPLTAPPPTPSRSTPPAMCPERAQPLASQRVVGKGKLLLSSFCRDDNWPCFSRRFLFDRCGPSYPTAFETVFYSVSDRIYYIRIVLSHVSGSARYVTPCGCHGRSADAARLSEYP